MLPTHTLIQAENLLRTLRARHWTLATAESCTGGLIAAALTHIAGSSAIVECGFVTYSNAAKTRLLGVSAELIAQHGAVSEPVAAAMAQGALIHSDATIAISVTGIAGPGGGSVEKPVGLVWFGRALRHGPTTQPTPCSPATANTSVPRQWPTPSIFWSKQQHKVNKPIVF